VKFQCYNVMNNCKDELMIQTENAEQKDCLDYEKQKIRIKTYEALFSALDNRPNAVFILNQALQDLNSSEIRNNDYVMSIINELNYFLSFIQSNDNTVWK